MRKSRPMSIPATLRTATWRTPAVVLVCGCLITILTFGPRSSLGLFLTPMTTAHGWGRESFAFAVALQNLLWGAGQPFAGAIADRYGAGRVLAVGGAFYALGLVLMAFAATPVWLALSAGVMIGLATSAASFTIVLAAFGRMLPPERRSWAFGLGTAAGSFGQFLFAPLGQAFIQTYGWQTALVLMGCMMLAVPALAPALAGRPQVGTIGRDQTLRAALAEAFGHGSYLLLVAGFFVCGFHVAFITTHLPPYLVDLGVDARWGAWSIAVIGLFNVIGSYGSGVLGGRHSKRIMLSLIYLLRAVVIALFVTLPISPVTVLLFAAAIGLLWLSTVPPTSGLVALMFGTRYLATLSGVVFFSHQVGAFLGVWLGGRLYDATGSYAVVWWMSVALGLLAAAVHWPIRERPVERLRTA